MVVRAGVYGGALNIASRICGLCVPGDILVSATLRDLARTSAGVAFEDRGQDTLECVEDPVRVFAVTCSVVNLTRRRHDSAIVPVAYVPSG